MYQARNTKNRRNCLKLFEEKEGRVFIVFDTETTGKDVKSDYIVEFAAIKLQIVNQSPEIVERLDVYIRPPFYMDEKVISIHHITNEYLEDQPSEDMVFPVIRDFLGERPILLGYNVDFDTGMLRSMYERCGERLQPEVTLDVMEMGYDLIYGKDVPDHKLGTLVRLCGLDTDIQFHNALDDALATYRLLLYFYNEYKSQDRAQLKQSVYVNAIYYWKGFNKEQAGIYLKTNVGLIYFSTYLKMWRSSAVDLSAIDIDQMESIVLQKTGVTFKELGRMTERKFNRLKLSCRERGVYL